MKNVNAAQITRKQLKSIISEEVGRLSEEEVNEFLGMLPGSSKNKMAKAIKALDAEADMKVTRDERNFMFDAAVQMIFANGVIQILGKSKDPDVKRFVRYLQGSNITEAEMKSQRRRNKQAGSSTGTTPEIAAAQAESLQKAMKNKALAAGVWKALHLVKDLPSMREYMRGSIARKWLEKTTSEWGAAASGVEMVDAPEVEMNPAAAAAAAGETPPPLPTADDDDAGTPPPLPTADDATAPEAAPAAAAAPAAQPKTSGASKQSLDQMMRAMFSNLRFSKLTDTDKQTIKKAIYGWAGKNLSLTESKILAFTERIIKLNELQSKK
jgi:hypothetical protein